jgi:hypothetical protein
MKGQSLIELMLAIGLAAVILPALLTGFVVARGGRPQLEQRLLANALVQEGQEAARVIREKNWAIFGTDGSFYLQKSGSSWQFTTDLSYKAVNGFSRTITVADVYRDASGNIVSVAGTPPAGVAIDPSTKSVTTAVSWSTPHPATVNATQYLTRVANASYTETSTSQFQNGTFGSSVNVTGDQVVLGAGHGGGDWCTPSLSITATDLPKNGVANAIAAIEGRIFAGTGDNASGVSFANVTVNNANPPGASVVGTFNGFKTNGVFGESNYAYLATDTNAKEIEIINLTTTPYTEAGFFNAPGNGTGNSVYVVGTRGYMTDANKLYTFDLTSKTGSRPILGTHTLNGTGNKVFVVGNYAYVAINGTANQLEIVQISPDGTTMTRVSSLSLPGQVAKDLFVNAAGSRAYIVTAASSTQKEFFVIDISNKSNPAIVGSYEANGMNPKGVTVVTNNKAIIVGTSGEEYQVINLASETAPVYCGGLNIDTGINGVSSVLEADGDAYSYIITGDASTELKIIQGGPGGGAGTYTSAGTFTSQTFDAGHDVAFNYFSASISTPGGTSLSYAIAIKHGVTSGGSTTCSGVTFSDIDFVSVTPGQIPLSTSGYVNPGQCLRYRINLSTSDTSQTPTLSDITFNYSL